MSVSLNNVNSLLNTVNSENDTHRAATNNPHNVTASQVGALTSSQAQTIASTITWTTLGDQNLVRRVETSGEFTYTLNSSVPTNARYIQLQFNSGECHMDMFIWGTWQRVHNGGDGVGRESWAVYPLNTHVGTFGEITRNTSGVITSNNSFTLTGRQVRLNVIRFEGGFEGQARTIRYGI